MSNDQEPTDTLLPAAVAGLGALLLSILVGVALSPARDTVGLENVAMIYMAVVAVAAIAGGTAGGLMAALGAALSYNFFFTTPYRTLRIDSFEQVGTVALLFIAGALISFAANATRGRLFDSDVLAARGSPSEGDDTAELVDAVARARADGRNAGSLAVQGLQRLHDAQWVALIPFDDASDRAVVWAGDPPAPAEVGVTRSGSSHVSRRPPTMGAVAHMYVEQQHPAVLVVLPRPRQPVTDRMEATLLAVAHALEAPPTEGRARRVAGIGPAV